LVERREFTAAPERVSNGVVILDVAVSELAKTFPPSKYPEPSTESFVPGDVVPMPTLPVEPMKIVDVAWAAPLSLPTTKYPFVTGSESVIGDEPRIEVVPESESSPDVESVVVPMLPKVLTPVKYGMLPMTAAEEVERPFQPRVAPESVIGQEAVSEFCFVPSPVSTYVLTAFCDGYKVSDVPSDVAVDLLATFSGVKPSDACLPFSVVCKSVPPSESVPKYAFVEEA